MTIGMKGPGLYIQGEGELDKLGKYVKKLGDKFLIICSPVVNFWTSVYILPTIYLVRSSVFIFSV